MRLSLRLLLPLVVCAGALGAALQSRDLSRQTLRARGEEACCPGKAKARAGEEREPRRFVAGPRPASLAPRAGIRVRAGGSFKISAGSSRASAQFNPNEFGDYLGVTFHGGHLYPAWADNSQDLPGHVGGDRNLDVAVADVTVSPDGTVSVGPTVNASPHERYQGETAIAVNPTNPQNLVFASNDEIEALYYGYSMDGGVTWTSGTIADEDDPFPLACCDPTIAFDQFGNCFLGYLSRSGERLGIEVLVSTNGGVSFTHVATLDQVDVDQPTLVTGPGGPGGGGSLWVTWHSGDDAIKLAGAPVAALGQVGAFRTQTVRGSRAGNFGDVAVGPDGEVAVCWTTNETLTGPGTIWLSVDRDGLGGRYLPTPAAAVTRTEVGSFNPVGPQQERTVDSEPSLAYDRSPGPRRGRLYLAYTDERDSAGRNTEILLRASDDGGLSWSGAAVVNEDQPRHDQFFPRVVVDDTTGIAAVVWYDATRDLGNGTGGNTNGKPNTDVEVWGALVLPQPPPAAPPAAPTDLRARLTLTGRIDLEWTDPTDADTDYQIERKVDEGPYTTVDVVGPRHTFWVDFDVDRNHVYTYQVRAVNEAGASDFSNEATVDTTVAPVLGLKNFYLELRGTEVQGGKKFTAVAVFTGAAPRGGVDVFFTSSDRRWAFLPAKIHSPRGATRQRVTISTRRPSSPKTVLLTARIGTQSVNKLVAIKP